MAAYMLTIRPLRLRIQLKIERLCQPREGQEQNDGRPNRDYEQHLTQYSPNATWQASTWRR